jgi:hypothetical protein
MSKYVLTGVIVLLLASTQSAQAQVLFSRPFRPIPSGPAYGYGYPYGSGGYGNPLYGYGRGVLPYQTPLAPGLLPGGVGTTPGGLGTQQQVQPSTGLSAARPAGAGLADPGSPDVTGHPTRFAAYSGYFNNQGGGLNSPSVTAPYRTPATSTAAGGTQQSTTMPSRSKSGSSGSSR